MNLIKVCVGVASIVVTLAATEYAMGYIKMHVWLIWLIVGVVSLVAGLLFGWLIFTLWEKISEKRYRSSRHALDVRLRRAEIAGIEEMRISEILKRDRLQERSDKLIEIEANKLEWAARVQLKELELRAEEARYMRLNPNEILAIREGGARVELVYVPPVKISPAQSDRLIELPASGAELLALPAARMPSAMEIINSGALSVPGELMLGFSERSEAIRRTWRAVKAILILGLQGGGKTNTAIWLIIQVLLQGGKLALIDKHARSEEDSMYQQIKPFESAFVTPAGDSPQAALRVLGRVKAIFHARMDDGAKVAYPLLLVIDEFSAIMRQVGGDEKWSEVADALKPLIEDLNIEGRKHGCYAVCVGQVANASRSGGTEIRDTFNTRIIHGMREKQAGLVGLSEEKKAIRALELGQAFIDMEGKDQPFFCAFPHVTQEVIAYVASRIVQAKAPVPSQNLRRVLVSEHLENGAFGAGSNRVQERSFYESGTVPELPVNEPFKPVQADMEKLSEREERVLNLLMVPVGKQAIIEEVWECKKGGSERYKQAVTDYGQIVEKLARLELVKVQ